MPLKKSIKALALIVILRIYVFFLFYSIDKQLDCASRHSNYNYDICHWFKHSNQSNILFLFGFLYLFLLLLLLLLVELILIEMLLRKDPCGIICIALTYTMLCHCLYVVLSVIIIPYFNDRLIRFLI